MGAGAGTVDSNGKQGGKKGGHDMLSGSGISDSAAQSCWNRSDSLRGQTKPGQGCVRYATLRWLMARGVARHSCLCLWLPPLPSAPLRSSPLLHHSIPPPRFLSGVPETPDRAGGQVACSLARSLGQKTICSFMCLLRKSREGFYKGISIFF